MPVEPTPLNAMLVSLIWMMLSLNPNITMDVAQALFGQTVTISDHVIAQYGHHGDSNPNKWMMWDAECEDSGRGALSLSNW
jgi:formylmethanofuran dehydrogenase subunit A